MKKTILNHKQIVASLFINAFFFTAVMIAFKVCYSLPDDWYISDMIANGYTNNIFNGYFIQIISFFLQKIIYPVNAFVVLQILLCYISFVSISYVFYKLFSFTKATVVSVAFTALYGVAFYPLVGFTNTAAILALAGYVFIFYSYFTKQKIGYYVFGIFLCLVGSWYRFVVFYSVSAVFAVFFVTHLFAVMHKPLKKSLADIFTIKNIAAAVSLVAVVFGFSFVSNKIINSSEEVAYYRAYNSPRSRLVDYAIPDYDTYKQEYNQIGISENDYIMITAWSFDDEGATDLNTINKIAELQSKINSAPDYKIYAIKNMLAVELRNVLSLNASGLLIVSFELLCLAIFAFYKKSLKFIISANAICALLYTYLWIGGRVPFRAVLSIWITASAFMIISTVFMTRRQWFTKICNKKTLVATVSIALVLVLTVPTSIRIYDEEKLYTDKQYDKLCEYVESSDGVAFAMDGTLSDFRSAVAMNNPLSVKMNDAYSHCVLLGGAYYPHPYYFGTTLKKYGIKNSFKDLIDNENYLYCSKIDAPNIQRVTTYLNEHYSEGKNNVTAEKIQEIDGVAVYKFVTE